MIDRRHEPGEEETDEKSSTDKDIERDSRRHERTNFDGGWCGILTGECTENDDKDNKKDDIGHTGSILENSKDGVYIPRTALVILSMNTSSLHDAAKRRLACFFISFSSSLNDS